LSTRQQDEPLTVCFFCPRFVENGDTPTTLATKLIDKVQKTGSIRCPSGPNHKTTDQAAKVAVRSGWRGANRSRGAFFLKESGPFEGISNGRQANGTPFAQTTSE